MFSTSFTSCSIGVAAVPATTLALAPGYVAVTEIVGGATSGYWAIGSCVRATTPTMTMTIDSTVAKMGRSMKKWVNIGESPPLALGAVLGGFTRRGGRLPGRGHGAALGGD